MERYNDHQDNDILSIINTVEKFVLFIIITILIIGIKSTFAQAPPMLPAAYCTGVDSADKYNEQQSIPYQSFDKWAKTISIIDFEFKETIEDNFENNMSYSAIFVSDSESIIIDINNKYLFDNYLNFNDSKNIIPYEKFGYKMIYAKNDSQNFSSISICVPQINATITIYSMPIKKQSELEKIIVNSQLLSINDL